MSVMNRLLFLCLFCFAPLFVTAKPADGSSKLSTVLEDTLKKVVTIYTETNPKEPSKSGGGLVTTHRHNTGSGFFIASDGTILTNAHVVKDAKTIVVRLHDGLEATAEVVGIDHSTDIAILKTSIPDTPYISMKMAQLPDVGDTVFAIGNGFNLPQSVTRGIVSALHRSINEHSVEDFIQTDSSINMGNSGGPLINEQGQLVGVNNMIIGVAGGNNGVGFAIPTKIAYNVAFQITQFGGVKPGQLGVVTQELTPALAAALKMPAQKGALISQVLADSPAEKAGIRVQDVVVGVDGQKVMSSGQCRSLIYTMRAGSGMRVHVLRQGKKLNFDVRTRDSDEKNSTPSDPSTQSSPLHGVTLVDHASIGDNGNIVKGIRVIDIQTGTKAWLAGLHPGDIITHVNAVKISRIEDVRKLQTNRTNNKDSIPVLLEIVRGAQMQTVFLAVSP